jgi:alpha/beta hydrolase fold
MWRKMLPALAEHFTVIAPDLRGSSGSDAPSVLAMGAEGTMGTMVRDQVVGYAKDVTGAVAPTGHWVAEEDPDYLTHDCWHSFPAIM